MTEDDLKKSKYSPYPPNHAMGDAYDVAYCKTIWKGKIKDYHIHVHIYRSSEDRPLPFNCEIMLAINDGCKFFPSRAAMRILIYAGPDGWTVEQTEACCAEMMQRLENIPYGE